MFSIVVSSYLHLFGGFSYRVFACVRFVFFVGRECDGDRKIDGKKERKGERATE